MKKWNKFVAVAPKSRHLFTKWTEGSSCSGCNQRQITVKAYVDDQGRAFLAERNLQVDIKYGNQFEWVPECNCGPADDGFDPADDIF